MTFSWSKKSLVGVGVLLVAHASVATTSVLISNSPASAPFIQTTTTTSQEVPTTTMGHSEEELLTIIEAEETMTEAMVEDQGPVEIITEVE